MARLRRKLAQVPGAPTYLQPVQDLRIGGRASNALYQYTLQGDNLTDLIKWAPRILQQLRTLPALIDVSSDQQEKGGRPRWSSTAIPPPASASRRR